METDNMGESEFDNLPEPVVKEGKSAISIIWVVPLVALVIGGWLVYKALTEKGPIITISFETAQGLEAGKTHIKYKDVTVGRVEKIDLSPDLSTVVVQAQLTKNTENLLTEGTRFWVVRARLSVGEISGLGTLFSGAYIGMDPGPPGKPERHFTGLEKPPVVTTDLPGSHFALRAARLGSLDVGSPVYYRQIRVGQVVGYQLEEAGKAVIINIFIGAPHHRLINTNTRFWNAGGFDVTLDVTGVRVSTESLTALLLGGIAFETPANLEPGLEVDEGHRFMLYESRKEIFEKTYAHKFNWLLYFDGSVHGLSPGAPVEFRGIRVGKVLDVSLELDPDNGTCRIPVLIETTPERFWPAKTEFEASRQNAFMSGLVEKGLRACLKTGSLITGKLFVELDIYPHLDPAKIDWSGRYPVLPTLPGPTEEILDSLSRLLVKLERMPLEEISRNLKDTLQGTNRLVHMAELPEVVLTLKETLEKTRALLNRLDTTTVPEFNAGIKHFNTVFARLDALVRKLNDQSVPALADTLEQAQAAFSGIDRFVSADAALYHDLKRALSEIAGAARTLRVMAEYLSRHPEALIYGKGNE